MNVAIITDSFPPMVDGVSRCALGYAKALQDGGHGNCIVITPHTPRVKHEYSFPVYGFPSVSFPYAEYRAGHPFVPHLAKKLKNMNIEILHAHSPFTSMILARQLRRLLKIPIVFTQHTKWDFDIAQAISSKVLQREIARYVYKNLGKADDLWAVSRGAGEYLVNRGYKGSFTVMQNGTDFKKAEVDPAAIEQINNRFNIPEGVPVLLFVGRMLWYKNIALTIETLELLHKRKFDFRMIFVGDGEDYTEIIKMVQDKGLAEIVHFTGNIDDRDDLMTYYMRADLFLFLSVYDNAPLVIQEAAACACPAIVVRDSSTSEIIDDGITGFFAEENAESAADAIIGAFSDKKRLEEIGIAASEQVYSTWEKAVERAVSRYEFVKEAYKEKHAAAKSNKRRSKGAGLKEEQVKELDKHSDKDEMFDD